MSLYTASAAVLTLCLCVWTAGAVPIEALNTFNCDSGVGESIGVEEVTRTLNLPSLDGRFVELESCRDSGRLEIHVAGKVTFLPRDVGSSDASLEFDVFTVDYAEIKRTSENVQICEIIPSVDSAIKNSTITEFNKYFPRRTIDPTYIVTITWDLTNNDTTERNLFQSVFIFDTDPNRNILFVIYQYVDNLIQWAEGPDDTYASVRAELCAGEDVDPFILPNSGTPDIIDQVLGQNIPEQSDKGKVVFLIADDDIIQHIPCRNCSLEFGDCMEANVCICQDGYTTDINAINKCTLPVCSDGCVNGNCTAPDTCECEAAYTGKNCSTLTCNQESQRCLNGGNCTDSGVCLCPNGWTDSTCNTPICDQNCLNGGNCTAPNTCNCSPGWIGGNCSQPVCNTTGCVNGVCVRPDECECEDGWSGSNCTLAICDSCDNGDCVAPDDCQCYDGYQLQGETCTEIPEEEEPTESQSDGGLSGAVIGGIVGGIFGLVIIIVIIVFIVIGALCF